MWDSAINMIGMFLISGKYILVLILAALAFGVAPGSTELLMMQGVDTAE